MYLQLTATQIDMGIAKILGNTVPTAKCHAYTQVGRCGIIDWPVVLDPPSERTFIIIPSCVMVGSPKFQDRYLLHWAKEEMKKPVHVIIPMHEKNHWTLLVRTADRFWVHIDSIPNTIDAYSNDIIQALDPGTQRLFHTQFWEQSSTWDCGHCVLAAIDWALATDDIATDRPPSLTQQNIETIIESVKFK